MKGEEADARAKEAGWTGTLGKRLVQGRWTLAAAAVAFLGLTVWTAAPPLATAAGFALVVLAILLGADRRRIPVDDVELERGNEGELSPVGLAAAVPDPLVIFGRGGVVVHANPPALRAFSGMRAGLDLRLRLRTPEMLALIEQALAGEERLQPVDYVERVPIERFYRVEAASAGEGSGLHVLVFRDQSETRRIDRMRADFIANASHEMRTPLATISGFIETLRGPAKNDPAARERFLDIMHSQTARMARLIDDLLTLSRIETRPPAPPGDRVDLKQTIAAVLDSLNHLAAENGIEFIRRFPEGEVSVPGSRDELFQVFENLVENACKYGQGGGRVEVIVETEPGEARVTVRDWGPGIAQEHIPRLTERFYRVDVESSREQKGTGLGLSIVKHMLVRHDGRLSIHSQLGEGAAFTVHLPLA